MSWTRITGDLLPTGLVCGWVGGYDGDEWKQTPAFRRDSGLRWYPLDAALGLLHPVTYFAPFLIPEPPPKSVSLRQAGESLRSLVEDLEDVLCEGRAYNQKGLCYIEGLSQKRCQQVLDSWRDATKLEDANAEP